MSVPTDSKLSVKEYNNIIKYKDLWIETEKKIGALNFFTMLVILETQVMIKNWTDSSPSEP